MSLDLLDLTARAEASHFWFRGFRRFLTPVLSRAAAGRTDLRLVDCGAGTGNNLTLLAPYGRVFAFDFTAGGLGARWSHPHPLVRADITRIPFKDGSFDVATAFDVLQCIQEDAAAVREMARIVKPGGTIVLTVAALELLRGDHAEVWREARRYTPAAARALLAAAGLEPVRVTFMFASVFPLTLATRLLQRVTRPFRQVRPAVDIAVPPAPINAALTAAVSIEAALLQRMPMPIGSSLLVVGRKRL